MNTSLRRKVKKRPVVIHRPKKVVNTHDKSHHRSMLSHSYNVSSYKMKINALLSNNRALAQALESANMELSDRARVIIELQRQLTLQSPKIFKTKLQKVCEHLHIIVGLLQEVMEECDSYKHNLNDQLIVRDEKSLGKGTDEINNENVDVLSVNETPHWGNQQMFKVIKPAEMPAIVEQPEMIMDSKCQTSLNPELSADMSKINVRSRSKSKSKSFPRRQSQRNLSPNSDYINNEKLQFSCTVENFNPSFSTQINKSPMVMREYTENFNLASEDKSPKTDSTKSSKSNSDKHSLIPISRNKNKYELPSNEPQTSNTCNIEENVQKQKSSKLKGNLSSDKLSPNKKCTKVKGKSPDRRKTFVISHEKKSLKRETFVISELNASIASLSKVEDSNSLENSSLTKISSNCDKITSSSVVFENICNKSLSYVNSNTKLISTNENKKLGNNKVEKNETILLACNKEIYESDKNTVKKTRSIIEKSKDHKVFTDKKNIDIERNININETKENSGKESVKYESIKYFHNNDQLAVTNSVDENMSKEISPIVFQTKRRRKSIKRKSVTNNSNETQLPKIDNDIFDECHMKEKQFKNKELTTQIDNKELIIQLDDVLTPIKTPFSNKKEEEYFFITDPLDGSFLKVDTSIKFKENSVKEQNEKSQDNIEDLNNTDDSTENLHREGRKRRAVVGVSYKEPAGNKKLRQGDPFTSTIYDKGLIPKITEKNKKDKKKNGSLGRKKNSGAKHFKEINKQIIDDDLSASNEHNNVVIKDLPEKNQDC